MPLPIDNSPMRIIRISMHVSNIQILQHIIIYYKCSFCSSHIPGERCFRMDVSNLLSLPICNVSSIKSWSICFWQLLACTYSSTYAGLFSKWRFLVEPQRKDFHFSSFQFPPNELIKLHVNEQFYRQMSVNVEKVILWSFIIVHRSEKYTF